MRFGVGSGIGNWLGVDTGFHELRVGVWTRVQRDGAVRVRGSIRRRRGVIATGTEEETQAGGENDTKAEAGCAGSVKLGWVHGPQDTPVHVLPHYA